MNRARNLGRFPVHAEAVLKWAGVAGETSDLASEIEVLRAERDRLRLEVALAQRFRSAVEAARIGIMSVNAKEGRYIFANPTYAKMLGYPLEELLAADPYQ